MHYLFIYVPSIPLGFCLFLTIAVRWFMAPADNRRTEYLLLASLVVVVAGNVAMTIATALSRVRPYKFDQYIYTLDGIIGFQPAFALGRALRPHPLLTQGLIFVYGALPIAVIACLAGLLYLREKDFLPACRAFTLNLLAAPVFYLLFPVCGPLYAFPTFPFEPASFVHHPLYLNAAPNGVPSIHFSTALLLMWFSRHWKTGKALSSTYAALMIAATLGNGEHYLFDLVAAIPYTLGVWQVSSYLVSQRSTCPVAT